MACTLDDASYNFSYLLWQYGQLYNIYSAVQDDLTEATIDIGTNNYSGAIQHVMDACDSLSVGFWVMTEKFNQCDPKYVLPFYLKHHTGGTITMEDVINAMLVAENDELTTFIGLVDAYRQSIWNQPFDKEFFSSLGRNFVQWR